jgi:hypothetical protein
MKYLVRGSLGLSLLLATASLTARPTMADKLNDRLERRTERHERRGLPEIDPAGMAGAVVLVGAGTLLLKSRKRKAG